MSGVVGVNTRVIYFEKEGGSLSGNENINQTVFDNTNLFSFNYEWVSGFSALLKAIRIADTLVVYGHFHKFFRVSILLAKLLRKNLILTSDATNKEGIAGSNGWKLKLKPYIFKLLYNHIASALFVPSNASKNYFEQIGIKNERIILTPYTVNEDFLLNSLNSFNASQLKSSLGINDTDTVFLFCGKLIERKRPEDLLSAFALLNHTNAKLIIVGDGPLRNDIERLSSALNIQDKLIITGLVPYHQLAAYYAIASVLTVPAEHEPYGLPVNESMILGTPVIASNAVGAAGDLIEEGITGFTYPVADINALAAKMQLIIDQPHLLNNISVNAVNKMKIWSSQSNVNAQLNFFKQKGWL